MNLKNGTISFAARCLWRMPGRFGAAALLGRDYGLRCLVIHDVSPAESAFTRGMGVSLTPEALRSALTFVAENYTPVSLDDVLSGDAGRALPKRPMLVTFDDGYCSVLHTAVPLCRELGIRPVFFVNAAFIDNHRLAPDNIVCYAVNTAGMEAINRAAMAVKGTAAAPIKSMTDVFSNLFPTLSLDERNTFLNALKHEASIDEEKLAAEACLYFTRQDLRKLAALGFEIGNHTYSHARCRSLSAEDVRNEVERNQVELELLTGRPVRSFSIPYGSSADLNTEVKVALKRSGHHAVFLSESVSNREPNSRLPLDRVSLRSTRPDALFFDIEVLPRLRALRNRFIGRTGTQRPLEQPVRTSTSGVAKLIQAQHSLTCHREEKPS